MRRSFVFLLQLTLLLLLMLSAASTRVPGRLAAPRSRLLLESVEFNTATLSILSFASKRTTVLHHHHHPSESKIVTLRGGDIIFPDADYICMSRAELDEAYEEIKLLLDFVKVLAKFGSPQFAIGANLGWAAGGVAIGGVSFIKCMKTKNVMERIFYGTGSVCGTTAAIAGFYKACSGKCGLSALAVFGDTFGGACLYLGNHAQKIGEKEEDDDDLLSSANWHSPIRLLRHLLTECLRPWLHNINNKQ